MSDRRWNFPRAGGEKYRQLHRVWPECLISGGYSVGDSAVPTDRIVEIQKTCGDIAVQVESGEIQTLDEAIELMPTECLRGISEGAKSGLLQVE